MTPNTDSEPTDIVFIESLSLSAKTGRDCWGRFQPQPLLISVHLVLQPLYLDLAGSTDNVHDSLNYGTLSKAVAGAIRDDERDFQNLRVVAAVATKVALELAGERAVEVRVRVEAPKAVLMADGLAVTMRTRTGAGRLGEEPEVRWHVKDFILGLIIGVNSPERETKQRVLVNLEFLEEPGDTTFQCVRVIRAITNFLEASECLTLEKFAMEAVRFACLSSEGVSAVTVRAQKPSAVAFAHSSGVEITRSRVHFQAS